MHIADALKEKGYEIDRRRVHLPEPIKETGEYTVSVRLHREVTVEIPVTVTGEGGAQTAGDASADANTASDIAEARADAAAPAPADGPNEESADAEQA
jgi:large subunit ribosomal protein L9